jgi:hypothetical protein
MKIKTGLLILGSILGIAAFAKISSAGDSGWTSYVSPRQAGTTRGYMSLPVTLIWSETYPNGSPAQTVEDRQAACEKELDSSFKLLIQRGLKVVEVVPCTPISEWTAESSQSRFQASIYFHY